MYINPFTATVIYAKLAPYQAGFSLDNLYLPFYMLSVILKGVTYCHGIVKTVPLIQEGFFSISDQMCTLISEIFCSFL